MSALQSRNPAMGAFSRFGDDQISRSETKRTTMTIGGTVTATGILLAIVAVVGIFTWNGIMNGSVSMGLAWPIWIGACIGGLVISFVIYSKPKLAPFLAPVHAAFEGAFVGLASAIIPMQFLGDASDPNVGAQMNMLILQAVLATFGIAGGMLLGYATGIIRVGPIFQKVIVTAGIGLCCYVGLMLLLGIFGISIWNGYADTGMMGIGFTVLCVGLASLFLVLDFQYIEHGVQAGAPKYYEWVGAWGLMVTLVWLYIEVLRLLAKLQSRD